MAATSHSVPKKREVDVSVYFDKVVEDVSHNWDGLARQLEFTENQIKVIRSDIPDQDRRCREMLWRWRNKHRKHEATLQVLQKALTDIGETATAGELEESDGALHNENKKEEEESDGPIDVKVERCTDEIWEKIMREEDVYGMERKPRGYAFILSNTGFPDQDHLPDRRGGRTDLTNISNLMEGLSFQTDVVEEKTAQEIKDEVRRFSQRKDHRDADCCVVVLMSHGTEGHIYGTDGQTVALEDIFSMFDDTNCLRLKGKPKLFFIQACRGRKVYKGDEPDSCRNAPKVDLKGELKRLLQRMPKGQDEADAPQPDTPVPVPDIFCGYATRLGYVSFRNTEDGSWFIQDITSVFMKEAKEKSLDKMMAKVRENVRKRKVSSRNVEYHGGMEEVEFDSTLKKELYFFPGL